MKTYVYIDGFNLYYAIKDTGCKWLDPKQMTEQVVPSAQVEKIRYFTARVSGAVDPARRAGSKCFSRRWPRCRKSRFISAPSWRNRRGGP